MDKFLEFAAAVFGCDVSEISGDTTYQEFELWDSLTMLKLLMEIEHEYSVAIPYADTWEIKTLGEIYEKYLEA